MNKSRIDQTDFFIYLSDHRVTCLVALRPVLQPVAARVAHVSLHIIIICWSLGTTFKWEYFYSWSYAESPIRKRVIFVHMCTALHEIVVMVCNLTWNMKPVLYCPRKLGMMNTVNSFQWGRDKMSWLSMAFWLNVSHALHKCTFIISIEVCI